MDLPSKPQDTVCFRDLRRKKILIVLSDGKPYDVIVNRPHAKNPEPYMGKYAINDTATEVRHLRNLGVSVLGVFAGEEKGPIHRKKDIWKRFRIYPGIFRIFPELLGDT